MNSTDLRAAITAGDTEAVAGWVTGCLTDVVQGRRPLSAVQHPLGFRCLPVERADGQGVCVHLWDPERPAPEPVTSSLHSHSWDLVSFVLFGAVGNELLRVVEEPDPARASHQVFQVCSGPAGDEIRPTGRTVLVAPGVVRSSPAGCHYVLEAGRFHRSVVPAGTMTATVVLGRTRDDGADLSLGPVGAGPRRVLRRRCDEDETTGVARTVLAGVSRRPRGVLADCGGDRHVRARG